MRQFSSVWVGQNPGRVESDRAIADFKKAIADLRKSLEIDPSDQQAKRILESLEERTR